MIIGGNKKLIFIFPYNDTGTTSLTGILSGAISESKSKITGDLLDTYGSDRHYSRHGSLCNLSYCSGLRNSTRLVFCCICCSTAGIGCIFQGCSPYSGSCIHCSQILICGPVYNLKNASCHQTKHNCQSNGSS